MRNPFLTSKHNSENQQVSSIERKTSRRSFFFTSLASAAVAVPAASLFATSSASASTVGNWTVSAHQAFDEIRNDENAHVAFLKQALGKAARPMPTFHNLHQKTLHDFEILAKTFENVGVGAYLMAAPAIQSKTYLAAAGSILTIEARHAGYLDSLVGTALSPNGAFDKPLSQQTIVKDVSPFIRHLNGGSDPSKPLTSDVDILNFALLLEYLEAHFYNINVPIFF